MSVRASGSAALAALLLAAGAGADVAINRPGRGTLPRSVWPDAAACAARPRALVPAAADEGRPARRTGPVADTKRKGGVAGGVGIVCSNVNPAACQLPDQGGHGAGGTIGATSDANPDAGFGVVDNFVLTADTMINTVCWWGFYRNFEGAVDCGPGATADVFTITYYANEPGCPDGAPDTVIATFPGVTVMKAVTGNMVGAHAEFEYTATHADVFVAAGECIWIEIQNDTSAQPDPPTQQCFWLWSTAPPGDEDSHQFGAPLPDNDFDLAFCVNGVLAAITDECILPVNPGCVGATGPCGAAHPATPGCDDPCCCTAVCSQLPLCCVTQGGGGTGWAQACADQGLLLGCAVFPLCQPEANCQVYGDLDAFNSTTHPAPEPDEFISADDFTVTSSGSITSVCWQGVYVPATATDSFTVRYYLDEDKLPGTMIAERSQAAGTLQAVVRQDTSRDIAGTTIAIFQYTATHAAVAVTAGQCYWIEISNNLPVGSTWFWELAEEGPNQGQPAEPLPREGNGRCLVDGTPPNGFTDDDLAADIDLSFCIGKVMATPACGFETVFDTGHHNAVLFDAAGGGNYASTHLGFSSGNLNNTTLLQRRMAQAFALPSLPAGDKWKIDQLAIEGFDPGSVTNNFINFVIYRRTALGTAPTDLDIEASFLDIPVDTVCGDPSGCNIDATTERLILLFGPGDLELDPGNYWLTMWASNTLVPFVASNFAWFTNAHTGINNSCQGAMGAGCAGNPGCPGPPGVPAAMWRACTYPSPGFQGYKLPILQLTTDPPNDPGANAADLLNCAMLLRGQKFTPPGGNCPWDTTGPGGPPDGDVGTPDFLGMLAHWGPCLPGPCPWDTTGPGGPPVPPDGAVGVSDFLDLLAHWGPCSPGGTPCPGPESCFSVHLSPGCNDRACCEVVCAIDPGCCQFEWDVPCLLEAQASCAVYFGPPQEFPAAGEPVVHAVDDLDGVAGVTGGGFADTAVVIPGASPSIAGLVQTFRNLGNDPSGQWQGLLANTPNTVGHDPSGIASGLFNADPHVDLAVTNAADDNVSILLNQGTGDASFFLFTNVPAGDGPSAVTAGDYDEDSIVDLAVTNENDDNVLILLGDGNGNFAPAASAAAGGIGVGALPVAISTGDFDDNKCPDLSGASSGAAAGLGPGTVFVLLGQLGGGFQGPVLYGVGQQPVDVATGDLDGDGFNDIVAANAGDSTLSILINLGDGSFAPAFSLPVGTMPLSVDLFDLENDGDPDIALVAQIAGTRVVQVLANLAELGPLAFADPFSVDVQADANFVLQGLFDGNGFFDLVTVNEDKGFSGGSVTVLLNASSCPWDCGNVDGSVNVEDFLAMLGQWGQSVTSCDFGTASRGVGIEEFLEMLEHWGQCP